MLKKKILQIKFLSKPLHCIGFLAFGSEKTVFAVQGGNFSKKKILRFWKSLKYV